MACGPRGRTLRQRELIIARDRANLDKGLHAASHMLATTLRSLDQAYEQYLAFKEAREAARENLNVQMKTFRASLINFIPVLQSITDWGNAITNEAASVAQYNTLLAELEQQTGTILETHGVRFYEERYGSIGPLHHLRAVSAIDAARRPTPTAIRSASGRRKTSSTCRIPTDFQDRAAAALEELPRPSGSAARSHRLRPLSNPPISTAPAAGTEPAAAIAARPARGFRMSMQQLHEAAESRLFCIPEPWF